MAPNLHGDYQFIHLNCKVLFFPQQGNISQYVNLFFSYWWIFRVLPSLSPFAATNNTTVNLLYGYLVRMCKSTFQIGLCNSGISRSWGLAGRAGSQARPTESETARLGPSDLCLPTPRGGADGCSHSGNTVLGSLLYIYVEQSDCRVHGYLFSQAAANQLS